MNRGRNIIWGIALIILGIIWGCSALDLFDIDLFFDGWWTLFIIIPSLIGVFCDDDKASNLVGLVIGVLLLLSCQEIIDWDILWKLIVPVIIIGVGLSLIFKSNSFKNAPKVTDGHITAIFAGHEIKITEDFKGSNLTSVFGGIDLDLRNAQITEDITINATAVFGGIDIYVPDNIKVKVKSTSVFGGVDNKANDNSDEEHVIYLNATCIFGGVDIK